MNRLTVIFGRHGIDIARSTMAKWMIKAAEKLIPLINLMAEDSLERKILGCDETPVQVLDEPGRKVEQNSYIWVTATMEGLPIILYNYLTSRGAKVAKHIFCGTIVCDGLKSYDCFANAHKNVILAACMAHIRRKFFKPKKL